MIRLSGVEKTFGALAALRGVHLDVPRGEVFGIIGRSGAGKSTLIRLLNGLERPNAGAVMIDGLDVTRMEPRELRALRRKMGMIFQNFGLLSSRTVFDNVAVPLRIAGAAKSTIAQRVPQLLQRVGLEQHRSKYPAQLSGGQKQRVGIARALATEPDILLCDEATSALDPETTRSILSLLADINRDLGLTIVLITHEMEVVRQVCDRVAVLDAGRVVEKGSVADVLLAPQAAETRAMLAADADRTGMLPFDGTVVRLLLLGDVASSPILTRVSRETGVDLTILDGHVGRLKNKPFGELTLGIVGGDQDAALAALGRYGKIVA